MRGYKGFVLLVAAIFVAAILFPGCATPSEFKLSLVANPTAGGNITPPGGSYSKGVPVSVKATASSGYRFDRWEGGASGNSPTVQITMDSNKKLTAYFTKTYSLSAMSSPSSGGNVSPSGGTYDAGKQVTLIATPARYYEFKGWAGDASGSSDHLTVTMDSAKSIVASFVKLTYSLQAQSDPPGSGNVDLAAGTYEAGIQRMITATPAAGYRFGHWGGNASGTSNPLNLLIDANKIITANFIRQYKLAVSADPISGTVAVNPTGGVYDSGATVSLTATPAFPYAFNNWVGADDNNANPTNVVMTADKSISATFVQLPKKAGPVTTGGQYIYNGNGIVTISLRQFEWVDGTVDCGTFPQVHAYIQRPDGGNIKDFGNIGQASFRFMAPVAGNYNVVVESNFVYGANYNITYTTYGLQ